VYKKGSLTVTPLKGKILFSLHLVVLEFYHLKYANITRTPWLFTFFGKKNRVLCRSPLNPNV